MFTSFDLWPRVATALVLVTVSILVARVLRRFLEPRLARMRTKSFGAVFSRLISASIVVVAFLVGLTIVFPSVNVATLLGGLGVLSIAAGFAFQDILSNLLAGILLIFRQPFVSGDQIEVNEIKGTVEEITICSTTPSRRPTSWDSGRRPWTSTCVTGPGHVRPRSAGCRTRSSAGIYEAFNEADIELPYTVVTLDAYDSFKDAMAEAGKP